jgi:large subunit ribosomal protein L10
MSKPVKNLITESYKKRFEGLTGAVVVDIRGMEANDNNALRSELAQKQIKVTVVKNSLAQRAVAGTELEPLGGIFDGPAAMVYPTDQETTVVNIARVLIDQAKKHKKLQFRGAVLDGIVFGPDEIKRLSEFPTKEEAQAKAIQIILTPGQNLVGAIVSPGRKLASIVKTIQEKLENGEEIKKAG